MGFSFFQNLVAFSNFLFLQQVMHILAINPELLSMPLQHAL